MKLLHVIATVNPRGGGPIEGVVRQSLAGPPGSTREIVSLDPVDAPFLADFPLKVYPLGSGRFDPDLISKRFKRFSYSPTLVPWLHEHAGDYDAVIVNGLWNYCAVGASRVLPGSGVPYFVFTHGMMDPWFRRQNLLKHLMKQASWLLFEGHLVANAKAVLFTAEEERLLARGEFWGHAYREEVVGYGALDVQGDADLQKAAFRRLLPQLAERPFLLFLSRIHQKKGCDLLVRAFAQIAAEHPDIDLVMAGPDQSGWAPALKAIARKLGAQDRIHWPGMLTGDAKWGAFRAARAFVLPSHQENFGIVVAEALSCGTPTLITDKVNIWREILDCGAGLVAPDTQDGIDGLLQKFLATDPAAYDEMRAAARTCFVKHFDIRNATASLHDLIERLL